MGYDERATQAIEFAAERIRLQVEEWVAIMAHEKTRPCVMFGAAPHWNPDRQRWMAEVAAWGTQSAISRTAPVGQGETPAAAMESFDKVYREGYATGGTVEQWKPLRDEDVRDERKPKKS